jgi:hypothetical protein
MCLLSARKGETPLYNLKKITLVKSIIGYDKIDITNKILFKSNSGFII